MVEHDPYFGEGDGRFALDPVDLASALERKRLSSLPHMLTPDDANRSWLMACYYVGLIGILLFMLCLCGPLVWQGPPWSLVAFVPWIVGTYTAIVLARYHRRGPLQFLYMAADPDGRQLLVRGKGLRREAERRADVASDGEWGELLADAHTVHDEQQAYLLTLRG